MGAYTSVINNTDEDMYIVYGVNWGVVDISMLTLALCFASSGAPGVALPMASANLIRVQLEQESNMSRQKRLQDTKDSTADFAAKEGYVRRPPGTSYVSEKLSLSLVHAANILWVKPSSDGKSVTVRTGYFTVWSGVTDGSTMEYNLSEYMSKLDEHIINLA